MTTEYYCLAIMGVITLLAYVPASVGKVRNLGLRWAAGNRSKPLNYDQLPEWVGRAERAHINLKDNFPSFLCAIILLGLTNQFNELTAPLAVVYVIARLGHFISYCAGVSLPRTITYFAGLLSNIALFGCLL